MSQHDFDIANQAAASARADINNALQALASLSSGDTAPSTTYANMLWYETDTNILKMRNEANSAWINVGYLDQGSSAFRILDDTQVMNTGGTQTGLLGDQATATWEAGSGTTESLISPAKLAAAVNNLQESKVWRSSDITSWTNGSTYTISHTLGVSPINVVYQFVCTVAHYGADVGDVVLLHGGERYANWGIQTTNITSSNLTYSFYSQGIIFRDKGSTATVPRTPANWKLRIVATG
jgi:hypothetical protein